MVFSSLGNRDLFDRNRLPHLYLVKENEVYLAHGCAHHAHCDWGYYGNVPILADNDRFKSCGLCSRFPSAQGGKAVANTAFITR